MTTQLTTPPRTRTPARRRRFGPVLRAEWIKFATVRGWIAGMLLAPLLIAGIALLNHSECGGNVTPGGPVTTGTGCPAPPTGPGGEAVTDSFYFVRQPLDGNGTITARVTSLTAGPGPAALGPWSKAGLIVKASTEPGSAYAAVMVTAGHGVRMQDDYTTDIAGNPVARSPQWLRLTRSGDTITGYSSADGIRWSLLGTAHLPGLPATATAQVGMFAAAPASSQTISQSVSGSSSTGAHTLAVARFDHVTLASPRPTHPWTGGTIGSTTPQTTPGSVSGSTPGSAPGTGFHQAGGSITVTGTGDIAPYEADADGGTASTLADTLQGTAAGLIAAVIVATMFMTAEYRRGLIRVTFAASPARGRVLAAKAAVIGSVTFLAGLAGVIAAVVLGERLLRSNGNAILPASLASNAQVVAGTAALLAVTAVLALALAAIFRRSAVAITVVIVVIVLPYLLALTALPGGAADWLLRLTPAAAFAIQQTTPQYPQVSASYTIGNGYFPLAPWAGFAVLCGYTVLALAAAVILLRRRDA